jgi:hypothetical protein
VSDAPAAGTRIGRPPAGGPITTIDIFGRFIRPVNAKKVETLRAERGTS